MCSSNDMFKLASVLQFETDTIDNLIKDSRERALARFVAENGEYALAERMLEKTKDWSPDSLSRKWWVAYAAHLKNLARIQSEYERELKKEVNDWLRTKKLILERFR